MRRNCAERECDLGTRVEQNAMEMTDVSNYGSKRRARKGMHFAFGSRAAEPMDRKQMDGNSLWKHSKRQ